MMCAYNKAEVVAPARGVDGCTVHPNKTENFPVQTTKLRG